MKADWTIRKLGDVCNFEGGSQPPKSKFSYHEKPHYVRFLQIRDFASDKNVTYIPESQKNRLCEENDILIGRYGASVGKILTGKAGSYNVALVKTIPNLDVLDESWFHNYLISAEFQDRLVNVAARSAQNGFSKEDIFGFPVPVPPLPEQKRIVGILDEAFDGIATAKANAEKNLQNTRALFESHLQSVFTHRGPGWERVVPLSSVLSVQPRNGWSPPAEYQTGTGVPVLTLSSVTGFEYDGSRVKLSSAPTRDDAHYWLKEGELLITRSNTRELVGHVAIYDGIPSKAICCDLIMKMQVDPMAANVRFIYYYLRSPEARIYFTTSAQGASSTMKKIGKGVVQSIPVPLPSLKQQIATAAMLDSLAVETQRLESIYQQKLAALEELKKSLLHEAFNGRL